MHLILNIVKKTLQLLLLNIFLFNSISAKETSAVSIGSEDAKIVIKVFSSLTCPHCANFHNKIFENLKNEYINTKKVKFEHHSFPLDMAALNAEKLLRSANSKDKDFIFRLLTEIYKKQDQWAVGSDIIKINESIKKIGLDFGLNSKNIDKFLKDEKIQDQILNERINAQKNYKISSTPTIYINEKKYEGKHEFDSFKKILDKLL
jgi:protein-disulfide isomerase